MISTIDWKVSIIVNNKRDNFYVPYNTPIITHERPSLDSEAFGNTRH